MKRTTKLLLSLGFVVALSSMFLTLCPDHAAGEPLFWWLVTATNNTGQTVYDFHAVFAGTGGTIENAAMVVNPGGAATITGSSNTIDIVWAEPGLAPGATFQFEFSTEHSPVELADAYFTDKDGNNIGDATGVTTVEPIEKRPTLSQWVLIVLALSVAGFFIWQLKRRRAAVIS